MTNYLSQLPDEIIDLILLKCNESYEGHADGFKNSFIQFEYIMDNPIRKIYHEYIGIMKNGYPNGTGTMYSGSSYIDHDNSINNLQRLATPWLYSPFIYIIRNCNPNYKLRYIAIS